MHRMAPREKTSARSSMKASRPAACPGAIGEPAKIMHRHDAGMLHGAGETRLAKKAALGLGIAAKVRAHHLDGQVAVQARIAAAIHLAHAAGAELIEQFIMAQIESFRKS